MDVQRRSPTRSPKRSHEACLNCRRKKQRCPGERPSCSSCTRLSQECVYRSNERRKTTKTYMEKRLAHIENQLSWILKDKRTDDPGNDCLTRESRSPSETSSQPLLRSPPINTIELALCLYFEYCHLQPLCCLSREMLQNPSALADELVHALLTLTDHFTTEIVEAQYHLSTARTLIMLRIANGTVDFAVLQSLALISYSYFLDGEFQLGQFHLGLALQLCRSTFMDHQSTYRTGSVDCESRSTVFWTFQVLEQFYGCQSGLLQMSTRIWRPSGMSRSSNFPTEQYDSEDAVRLPHFLESASRPIAVWSQLVHLGWIWSMVRKYVADAASNNISEPWHLNSSYAQIVADLMEAETAVPTCHRYDTVKFYQRQPQELKEDQDYWKPWLLLQFTYHAAHTMLNHPFLYLAVSQQNQKFARPNTFWRKSMDTVLLHATWITRIIDMVLEKQIHLTDLCFANYAALAATVHMYYCCAADERLRFKSRADLAKCLSFLRAFTAFSPPCQILDSKLQELLQRASGLEVVDLALWTPSKISLDAKLMWETIGLICQITWGPKPFQGLLHTSLRPSGSQVYGENLTFEVTITTSPEVTVQIADGGQAAPITNAAGAAEPITSNDTDEQEQNIALIMNECLEPNLPWLWQPAAQEIESGRIGNQDIATPANGDLWDSHWWSSGNL